MLWRKGNPSEVTVIEGKRLRVDANTIATGQVGGLAGIREGARQTTAHVRSGFSRAYLAVFVEVDSRERSGGHWLGGGLPFELSQQVLRIIETNLADQQVGFLMIELDQPIDKDVLLGGGIGLRHWRVAPKRSQPIELTERIRRFIGTVDAVPANDA